MSSQEKIRADFGQLAQIGDSTSSRYRGNIDGGGTMSVEANVILRNTRIEHVGGDLKLIGHQNESTNDEFAAFADPTRRTTFECTPRALGFPASWRGMDRLQLETTNGRQPLSVEFIMVGARGRITDRQDLGPGERATFCIDLIDLPLVQGRCPPFEPTGIRIAMVWEDPNDERELTVHSVELIPHPEGKIRPCVDAYGQRVSANWAGKVNSDDELQANAHREIEQLDAMTPPPHRSRYGGHVGDLRFEATGFFRVQRDSRGRWWYADPEGHPFWSVGATGIRYSDDTPVGGREFLFEKLPERDGPYAAAYNRHVPLTGSKDTEKDTVGFYRLNVLKKWGSFDRWAAHIVKRMRAWGYNTVANWSTHEMLEQREVPHCRSLSTRGPIECHVAGAFFDVWDPRWVAFFDKQCADAAAIERKNPWLIGYFVDNEMGWRNPRLLGAAGDAPLRDAWLAFLQSRYGSVEALNESAGLSCVDWAAARLLKETDLREEGMGQVLRQGFQELYAETYFSRVREILKRNDPNHLYLGCRFVRNPPRASIVRIAGRFLDVLSINCYSLLPDRDAFQKWHNWSGRPLQIGEHQLSLFGPRQFPQLWTCFTAEERRKYYPLFEETFARMPFSVGSHWFQFADQVVTGRPSNGENQIIGVVDVTDQPHPEMVESIREIAANMYDWHLGSA